MSDTFSVNHSDFFSLCSNIRFARYLTNYVLDLRLNELDNDNADFISRAACRIFASDLRRTISDLDDILQAALNIAPDDIRDFFSHYDDNTVAGDSPTLPF